MGNIQVGLVKGPVAQKYIQNGLVNYELIDEWLNYNLKRIQNLDISTYSHNEEFAFWLNAYNLLTIQSILTEFKKNPKWNGNLSKFAKLKFFILRRHAIAGKKISLYNLENKILRKKFKDPRIHFALNCGSIGCPNLPEILFTANTLQDYLEELTYDFINNQGGVIVTDTKLLVSRIFKWYRKDFKSAGGIKSFIMKYWSGTQSILPSSKIEFQDYNWKLNSISLN